MNELTPKVEVRASGLPFIPPLVIAVVVMMYSSPDNYLVVVCLMWLSYSIWIFCVTGAVVTNEKISVKTGFQSWASLPTLPIEKIVIQKKGFGSVLGYGSLTLHSTSGQDIALNNIADLKSNATAISSLLAIPVLDMNSNSRGASMGFISSFLVAIIKIGSFLCGLYCTYQYMNLWRFASTAMHEMTGTLFGLGAIMSFGTFAVIALLDALIGRASDIVRELNRPAGVLTPPRPNIQEAFKQGLASEGTQMGAGVEKPS